MLGCYDFCGHYDWTFRWIRQRGGQEALLDYWREAIMGDSQVHAATTIAAKGLAGMAEYWGHTLAEEAPSGGYQAGVQGDRFVIEMTDCPSRGFLLRNGIEFSGDYCNHCIGWIGPMMQSAGYGVRHAHNHQGQCVWEFFPKSQPHLPPGEIAERHSALAQAWEEAGLHVDRFVEPDGGGKASPKTRP